MRIALVAGETSGDTLGGALVEALKRRFPNAEFAGVAGPKMRAAGCTAWHDIDELAVMGLTEVITHLPRLMRLRAQLRRQILDWRPDVFVGVDYKEFNLGLARQLKLAGLATVQYVSPQVWAWRQGRVRTIGESVDLVLCLFPFEPDFYREHGVRAAFVGHHHGGLEWWWFCALGAFDFRSQSIPVGSFFSGRSLPIIILRQLQLLLELLRKLLCSRIFAGTIFY